MSGAEKDVVGRVMMAAVTALFEAGLGPNCSRAESCDYESGGQLEKGVEVTLFYSESAAQRIEARSDETPQEVRPEGEHDDD